MSMVLHPQLDGWTKDQPVCKRASAQEIIAFKWADKDYAYDFCRCSCSTARLLLPSTCNPQRPSVSIFAPYEFPLSLTESRARTTTITFLRLTAVRPFHSQLLLLFRYQVSPHFTFLENTVAAWWKTHNVRTMVISNESEWRWFGQNMTKWWETQKTFSQPDQATRFWVHGLEWIFRFVADQIKGLKNCRNSWCITREVEALGSIKWEKNAANAI